MEQIYYNDYVYEPIIYTVGDLQDLEQLIYSSEDE